jgi:non-lysosomal glucosylceramidase
MADAKIPYSKSDLFKLGAQITYTGRNLDEISFPLGGIGTGSIGLGGWGQLRDWEIMNRPAKGKVLTDGFFAIKARTKKGSVTKVLQGPHEGSFVFDGHGNKRLTGEGLPHFKNVSFKGEYPFAEVAMSDPSMPVEVRLEAFNPFIPLNDKDSSIPAAIFLYNVKNVSSAPVDVTIFGNLRNAIGNDKTPQGRVNEVLLEPGLGGIKFANAELSEDSPQFGSMALAALWDDVDVKASWRQDSMPWMLWEVKLWEGIAEMDELPKDDDTSARTGTVAARVRIAAGDTATIPWLLTWYFPTVEHWDSPHCDCASGCARETWRNWYASQWRDAWDVAAYVADNFHRLHDDTVLFHETLFSSTLPPYVLDSVSANISILKSATCLRLEDGTFYAFEGCSNTEGCCEGSCTHVWNYAQALPYLFPALQRSQREAEYKYGMRDDGFVQFRLPLPLGKKADFKFQPAADGQMGAIMQVYREWLISGDTEWLKSIWPQAKKALAFAWKYWDADRDGVMEGMQHNTYDIEFYGPNAMMETLYLGALRAAEEIATAVGDSRAAAEYRKLFEKGAAWTDKNLFNGEYYEQQVRPDAHLAWPEPQRGLSEKNGRDDKFPWPSQQYGKGCISDQVIGQWLAEVFGLGKLLDAKKMRKTLESIFKYNWRSDLSEHACTLRIYALRDEAALLIGSWPRGGRPGYPFMYADEAWPGIEYQVAGHMIYEGLVDEGLSIVKGVRDRHRGDRRNPWDEFECGHHYARSMASYAVLTGLSGFSYNGVTQRMGFAPRIYADNFRAFWSVGGGWGQFSQKAGKSGRRASVDVKYGSLALSELDLAMADPFPKEVSATLDGEAVPAKLVKGDKTQAVFREAKGEARAAKLDGRQVRIVFARPVTISAGGSLAVTVR